MTTSNRHDTERRYLRTIVMWLFVALTFFAFVHLISPACSGRPQTATLSTAPVPLAQPTAESPAVTTVAQEAAAALVDSQAAATALRVAEEARALSRSKLQHLRHQADDVLQLSNVFEQECDRWYALASEILSDERGKRLATDINAVQAYRALTAVERPDRAAATQARARVEQLTKPVDAAIQADDSAYMPSPELVAALNAEQRQVAQAADLFRRATAQLEGLVAAAQGNAGDETLAAVIQSLIAEEARAEASAVATAREEAMRTVRQQLAEAEAAKVREIGNSEVQRVRAEQSAAAKRLDAEAIRTRQQGERDRLRQLAADPDIQAKFAPFLSPGRRYPAQYEGSVRWLERKPRGRTEPRPVTLRELEGALILERFENFVAAATNSKSRSTNDRPPWPLPTSSADWDRYRQEFELFQQLVPVWVETQVIRRQ